MIGIVYSSQQNLILLTERNNAMKITLDLETCEIIVPKNFFKVIEKQNDLITKHGGTAVKPVDVIKNAFNTAMENTDKYLHTRA